MAEHEASGIDVEQEKKVAGRSHEVARVVASSVDARLLNPQAFLTENHIAVALEKTDVDLRPLAQASFESRKEFGATFKDWEDATRVWLDEHGGDAQVRQIVKALGLTASEEKNREQIFYDKYLRNKPGTTVDSLREGMDRFLQDIIAGSTADGVVDETQLASWFDVLEGSQLVGSFGIEFTDAKGKVHGSAQVNRRLKDYALARGLLQQPEETKRAAKDDLVNAARQPLSEDDHRSFAALAPRAVGRVAVPDAGPSAPGPDAGAEKEAEPLRFAMGGASVEGDRPNRNNEDAFWFGDEGAVLCDGHGESDGDQVAKMVMDHIGDAFLAKPSHNSRDEAIDWMKEHIREANVKVLEAKQRGTLHSTASTTLMMVYVFEGELLYVPLGDSSLELLRDGQLDSVSVEAAVFWHNYQQENGNFLVGEDGQFVQGERRSEDDVRATQRKFKNLINPAELTGEESRWWINRNVMENSLSGYLTEDQLVVHGVRLRPGDRLLLLSDGDTDETTLQERQEIMLAHPDDPTASCEEINAKAEQRHKSAKDLVYGTGRVWKFFADREITSGEDIATEIMKLIPAEGLSAAGENWYLKNFLEKDQADALDEVWRTHLDPEERDEAWRRHLGTLNRADVQNALGTYFTRVLAGEISLIAKNYLDDRTSVVIDVLGAGSDVRETDAGETGEREKMDADLREIVSRIGRRAIYGKFPSQTTIEGIGLLPECHPSMEHTLFKNFERSHSDKRGYDELLTPFHTDMSGLVARWRSSQPTRDRLTDESKIYTETMFCVVGPDPDSKGAALVSMIIPSPFKDAADRPVHYSALFFRLPIPQATRFSEMAQSNPDVVESFYEMATNGLDDTMKRFQTTGVVFVDDFTALHAEAVAGELTPWEASKRAFEKLRDDRMWSLRKPFRHGPYGDVAHGTPWIPLR